MADQEKLDNPVEETSAVLTAQEQQAEEDARLLAKYAGSYTGTFAHTLDGKGRMVIPQSFRELLGGSFTVLPEFDFKSVAIYPEVAYVRMREAHAEKLKHAPSAELRGYLQWLDAYTFRGQECDGQGRVLLPAKLRQVILGEDKDVDIMGAGDHLRVAVRVNSEQALKDFMANIGDFLSHI